MTALQSMIKGLFSRAPRPFVVAVDGPAASGKGTIAEALARHYDFDRLDTGALYRMVGWRVLKSGGDPTNADDAVAAASGMKFGELDQAALRSEEIGDAASKVAAIPELREALLGYQRDFAQHPPGGKGAVIDGRDIATVVWPAAEVKLFVTARDEVRAHRRFLELHGERNGMSEGQILADLKARDRRDSERAVAPLRPAPDAVLLETSELAIDAAVATALAIVDKALSRRS